MLTRKVTLKIAIAEHPHTSALYPLIAVSANIEQFSAALALAWGHASAIRWKSGPPAGVLP
ncbi:hypothetical protein [Paraburkholderia xenovorans]|uniref:hypothetical protein n=1 Tax=Paraburkholderia xenovorans TaxID=36873 RepID=UPI0038B9BA90